MKCQYCGQVHPKDFRFCPITGNSIEFALDEKSNQESIDKKNLVNSKLFKSARKYYVLEPCLPDQFNIPVGNHKIKMVLIPPNNEKVIEAFYISETPITMEQFRAVSSAPSDVLDYLAEYCAAEYQNYTLAPAFTVKNVLDFFLCWSNSIRISLPSRDQFLTLITKFYDRVKWYDAISFIGVNKSNMIEWEVISYHSNDIYCLLGSYSSDGQIKIRGNNFLNGEQRDNIAFRIVCSTEEAEQFIKTSI